MNTTSRADHTKPSGRPRARFHAMEYGSGIPCRDSQCAGKQILERLLLDLHWPNEFIWPRQPTKKLLNNKATAYVVSFASKSCEKAPTVQTGY